MRVLLDECVDKRLRNYIERHEAVTVKYAGFAGLKNGRLLSAAEKAGFEAVITVDQHIHEQQDLEIG